LVPNETLSAPSADDAARQIAADRQAASNFMFTLVLRRRIEASNLGAIFALAATGKARRRPKADAAIHGP
jgi:hypothetical protein